MPLPRTALVGALVALTGLACGEEQVVNGFGTYGSGKLQGFVSRADGSPVAEVLVVASFGPDAFVSSAQTDARAGDGKLRGRAHLTLKLALIDLLSQKGPNVSHLGTSDRVNQAAS